MKKTKRFTRVAAILLALSLAVLAAGCNKKEGDVTNVTPLTDAPQATDAPAEPTKVPDAPTPTDAPAAPTDAPAATDAPTPTEAEPEPADNDGIVRVSSIEEFVEAVKPEAKIVFEAGRYTISDYVDTFESADAIRAWNDAHEYVELNKVYDGWQILIKNTDGISISGEGPDMAAVELVTDPRYAAILTFVDCDDITLNCMTMGHTDMGDCSGNVVDLIGCERIYMSELDLYGCGVYGIGTSDGTGDLYVSSSKIRDCAYGPFDMVFPKGEIVFTDCALTGSPWGGYFEWSTAVQLSFIRCTFGDGETNEWYFADHAYMEDCVFGEVTMYPDYGDYSDYEMIWLDLENARMVPADRDIIAGSGWTGLYTQDVITDQLTYIVLDDENYRDVGISFYTDEYLPGEGWIAFDGGFYDVKWDITDDGVIRMETAELGTVFASLFETPYYDDYLPVYWLRLAIGNETFWLY